MKCKLPAIPTSYSTSEYAVGKLDQSLNSGVYFGASDANLAFDGSVFTRVNTNDKVCELGMEFKEGYVGILQQAKFFINYITDRTQYEKNLMFEGSNDGETYDELFIVDENVHEGWNVHDFEENDLTGDDKKSYPAYRYYRMRGLGVRNGPCRIHEIKFKGHEVIQDENDEFTCTPKLFLGDLDPITLKDQTFSGSKTPFLTSISPRWGTRLGGEDITFNGKNFSATKTNVNILIDGIVCPIKSATTTRIVCTTAEKEMSPLVPPSLAIDITGSGSASTQDI